MFEPGKIPKILINILNKQRTHEERIKNLESKIPKMSEDRMRFVLEVLVGELSSLSSHQSRFTFYVACLIFFAYLKGFTLTLGEAFRTKEMQEIYLKRGLTKAKVSQHQKRLAIDLNLFERGKWEKGKTKKSFEKYKILGDFWKSLDRHNRWGGDWGFDPGHFEYYEKGGDNLESGTSDT